MVRDLSLLSLKKIVLVMGISNDSNDDNKGYTDNRSDINISNNDNNSW